MGRTGRQLAVCVLAWGLAAQAGATILEPAQGTVEASADQLAGFGLSAQPLPGSSPAPGLAAQAAGEAVAQLGITEIASLLAVDRSGGASGEAASQVLFWVFGSGLLGAAFVARRRKPARRKV
jgi:hypothetical protein